MGVYEFGVGWSLVFGDVLFNMVYERAARCRTVNDRVMGVLLRNV